MRVCIEVPKRKRSQKEQDKLVYIYSLAQAMLDEAPTANGMGVYPQGSTYSTALVSNLASVQYKIKQLVGEDRMCELLEQLDK